MGGGDAVIPTHLELRDDRLVIFFERLRKGTHHFYYLARAVSPGTFHRPGLRADSMYAPEIFAQTASEPITIQ